MFIVGVIRVSYLLVITFQFVMTRNDYVVGVEKDEIIYFSFYLLDCNSHDILMCDTTCCVMAVDG